MRSSYSRYYNDDNNDYRNDHRNISDDRRQKRRYRHRQFDEDGMSEALVDQNDIVKVNALTKILAKYGYDLLSIDDGSVHCQPMEIMKNNNPIYVSGIDPQGRVIFGGLDIINKSFNGVDALLISQCMTRCSDLVKDLADIDVVLLR